MAYYKTYQLKYHRLKKRVFISSYLDDNFHKLHKMLKAQDKFDLEARPMA